MPMASATCWLSATARIAMPLRDFRKNQPKAARKPMLTPAPSSWMGGMNSGPTRKGSSRIGSGSGLVPEKIVNGPSPRRIDASPMVAMTTAITGRPMSLRSMTRSRTKPKAIRLTSASTTASHSGAPHTIKPPAATKPAIMTNSPCAKLMASVALYTSTKPSAISEYMSPISSPFDISRKKKPSSSGTRGHLRVDVFHPHARLEGGLAAVLVGDGGRELHVVAARVERVDDRLVLLGHEASPHLAGARHLGVVGLEVLGQEQEPANLRGLRQRLVALADLLTDEVADLGLLAQVRVARVGEPAPLGPVPHRVEIDGDHGGDEGALVAEGDRLADERAELQLVLDELRGERRAVPEGADVLGPIDDDQVAARIDEARVAGAEPAVGVDDLARGLLVLEVALEDDGAADEHLSAIGDLDLDARARPAGGRRVRLAARLQRHQARRLGGAVDLLQVDADRPEEAERVGAERRAAGERPPGPSQAELVADRRVDQHLAEHAGQTQPERDGLAVGSQDLGALGGGAESLEDHADGGSGEGGRVGGLHLNPRQHVFPDARRRQHRRRSELAQVALHRLRALRAVGAKADHEAQEQGVGGVARPRHRQVGERVVLRANVIGLTERLREGERVGVRQHDALRVAGRSGGVADDGDVFRLPLLDLGIEVAGVLGPELAPELLDGLIGAKPVVLVVEHAARIVVRHEAEARELHTERQHLVDLLLVLGHDHRALGVIPDEGELLRDRVLEDRHRHAAQALRGHLGPVQPGTVVADDRQPLAPLESERGEPEREVAHLVVVLAPGPRLPDAAVLLADRRPVAKVAGVALQPSRERGLSHGSLRRLGSCCRRDTP